MKVLKHFIYVSYGCVMQSGVVYSLNKDTMMSFWLRQNPNFEKFAPPLYRYNCVRVHPNAFPQHMKVLKHFIYVLWMCDAEWGGLQPQQ